MPKVPAGIKVLATVNAALLIAGIAVWIGKGPSQSVVTSGHGAPNHESGVQGQADGLSGLANTPLGSELPVAGSASTVASATTSSTLLSTSSTRSNAISRSAGTTPTTLRPLIAGAGMFDHIFIIMEENQNYSSVIGSSAAPTINALASANSNASNYHGVIHPSVNNYLGFVSGQTYSNISDSCTPGGSCSTNAPNLADQVEASGRTWKGYFEDMPNAGFDTYSAGKYVARHNPFVYFSQIRTNPARNNLMVPYAQLATDLQSASTTPNLVWVTPNLCDDMHDCSVSVGDTWLKNQLPTIFNSPAWKTQRSLLIITCDEDDFTSANQTFWVAAESPSAGPHSSGTYYDHYSTLRTLENAWGLAPLQKAATAPVMADLVR